MISEILLFKQNAASPATEKVKKSLLHTKPEAVFGQNIKIKPAADSVSPLKTLDIYSVASTMIKMIDAKDSYTAKHSKKVQKYAGIFARALGLSEDEAEQLSLGAAFHDIGKIGVPEAILNTDAPLDDEQFEKIKQHPEIGYKILQDMPHFNGQASKIVKHHHENWDGSGYPDKLSGDKIPLGARVVSIVDSYHAMISNRPYRKGMPKQLAIEKLNSGAGSQWDPVLTKEFQKIIPLI